MMGYYIMKNWFDKYILGRAAGERMQESVCRSAMHHNEKNLRDLKGTL
ncbi:hypothetical protein MgSA37_01529 [Mucilaginibacter gotjawali]|uniref:Uncharacterized protein n=2 Tax=Mucilaginibacter gotjawali TaxID=1550579 RepID=A0A839SB18_9SPHI|nr:hypothetical protein [Mucilaginibacter gotjawali]BAU53362.1 hypothetical protein MgSA37_01529 [Mucilaginibacter gotjawali]